MAASTTLAWPLVGRGTELERTVTALADPAVAVVQLVGPPGAGKTRLASECLREAELDGYPVARVSGGAGSVPLAGLAPLLPPDAAAAVPVPRHHDGAPTGLGPPVVGPGLVAATVAHVRGLADGSRVVVHVDDVDTLDAASADLLARLWRERLVVAVATRRSGTRAPAPLLAEHRAGGVLRVDVGDLPRRSVATLLHHVLRGTVSTAAEHALWQASRGNPLFLRELVADAVERGTLCEVDGVWLLDGDLPVSDGLAGLVADRLGTLEPDARTVVELLALCAPLGADELSGHCPPEVLEDLEARGVVDVRPDGRRHLVGLAHPVYAQVLRERTPRLRARRLLLEQLARTTGHGTRRREDVLRAASWRLDATGAADVGLLLAGARLARRAHDFALVERLCRAALASGASTAATALLGEALYEQGRADEGAEVLAAGAADGPPDGADGTRLALVLALVRFFGQGDLAAALEVLDRAGTGPDDPAAGHPAAGDAVSGIAAADDPSAGLPERGPALASMRALVLAQAGRSVDALAALPAVPPAEPELAAVHDRALAWAAHRSGDVSRAARTGLASWRAGQDDEERTGLLHPAGDLVVATLAHLETGEPERARRLAAEGRDRATADGVGFQAAWCAWAVATVDLVTGYAADAEGAFRELVSVTSRRGFAGLERLAALGLVECRALVGDLDGARRWWGRAEELPVPLPAFEPHVTTARAWLAAVGGDRRGAARVLREHGERLAETGEVREAVALLDEAVLMGDLEVVPLLLRLTGRLATPVGDARALRASATVSGAPADLMAAAEAFDRCDFVHSAATLAAQAAAAWRAAGEARPAAAAARRAQEWAARTPDVVIDGLQAGPAVTLTPRELEIAALVARGRPSKEVAAELVLSVRTVDNHLANAYLKLGINDRADLPAALGLPVRSPGATPSGGAVAQRPAASRRRA